MMKVTKELKDLVDRINENSNVADPIDAGVLHTIMSACDNDDSIADDLADIIERHDEFLTAAELRAKMSDMEEDMGDDNE